MKAARLAGGGPKAMITLHGLSLSLALACLTIGCDGSDDSPSGNAARSVDSAPALPALEAPSPVQSAGLFIGVGEFDHERNGLLYTVNDAVDLARALIEQGLLPMDHVRLLLSGSPSGDASERYDTLREWIGSPTKENIESALRAQAAKVGPKGILYVFIATHGYSVKDQPFIMAKDSIPLSPETAVSGQTLLEATQASKGRRVFILDTCRVRVVPSLEDFSAEEHRSPRSPESRSATPEPQLAKILTSRTGYAVFFATGLNGIAEPDDERQNGIFTGAILESLPCKDEDATAEPRMVGLSDLSPLVQDEARRRSDGAQSAELLTAAGFRDFLLVRCGPIGEILEPVEGQIIKPADDDVVLLRARQSGLFAKAVILAESNGVYYHQHPEKDFRTLPGEDVALPVAYGSPDRFQIYVGLGEDPEFLDREKNQISWLPGTDREGRRIRWLGPVRVTLPNSQ